MSHQRELILAGLRQLQHLNDEPLQFSVIGNSMWPTLRLNDEVFIMSSDSYSRGDILLFDAGERLIVHRLLKVTPMACYITKGDNRRVPDAEISFDQIIGCVTAIKRNGQTFPIQTKRQYTFRHLLQLSWLFTLVYRRFS